MSIETYVSTNLKLGEAESIRETLISRGLEPCLFSKMTG